MRIAVFDYLVKPTNPIGGCHWRMLRALCHEHEFTVFAAEFENPCPQRIKFVWVPAIKRPLALLFVTFHLLAPICYLAHRLRHRIRFDRLQMVESNLWFGDTSYCQFCHRAFLRNYRDRLGGSGVRKRLRLLDHWLHAKMEPWVFRRVNWIIVPSEGLASELKAEYPFAAEKIIILPNPVELERMKAPPAFNRAAFRANRGIDTEDLLLVFVALGHFERKGLPQLLDAMAALKMPRLKLCVVGGQADLVESYRRKCEAMHLDGQVIFAGMQTDVRPFLWSAEGFVLPSYYETFSLVTFEAAAAGVPIVVSRLYGVEEFLVDGDNGILVNPESESIRAGLESLLVRSPEKRAQLGAAAATSVLKYRIEEFVSRWKAFYACQAPQGAAR